VNSAATEPDDVGILDLVIRLAAATKGAARDRSNRTAPIRELTHICAEIETRLRRRQARAAAEAEIGPTLGLVRRELDRAMTDLRAHMKAIDLAVRAYRRAASGPPGAVLGYCGDGRSASFRDFALSRTVV